VEIDFWLVGWPGISGDGSAPDSQLENEFNLRWFDRVRTTKGSVGMISVQIAFPSWVSPGQRGAGAIMVGLVGEWVDERGHTTSQRASL